MSKHHHQSREEQIDARIHDAQQDQQNNIPHKAAQQIAPGDPRNEAIGNYRTIQLRAYQIFHEKGGSALDNWLEAERAMSGKEKSDSKYVGDGDPTT